MTGTVINAVINITNGRRQRSVTVDWLLQARVKRVTLKIGNAKSGKASAELETEETSENESVTNESLRNEEFNYVDEPLAVAFTTRVNSGVCVDTMVHYRT